MIRFHALVVIAILLLQTLRAIAAPLSGAALEAVESEQARTHFSRLGATDGTATRSFSPEELEPILNRAEARATDGGRAVLQKGRSMIANGEVVTGSCWDFIQAVYTRAGFASAQRTTAFHGRFREGPYAEPSDLQPGDWLYYINHSYGDGEHSGIFVDWIDFSTREALILSYRGENSAVPGRYSSYDLSHVYNITRPKAPGIALVAAPAAQTETVATAQTDSSVETAVQVISRQNWQKLLESIH